MYFCVIYLFQDKIGLVLVKTSSLIVMGTYHENMFPSICVEAIEKLGKLKSLFGRKYLI